MEAGTTTLSAHGISQVALSIAPIASKSAEVSHSACASPPIPSPATAYEAGASPVDTSEAEAILSQRYTFPNGKRTREYLVSWKGKPVHESTWEPESHLIHDATGLIKQFERARAEADAERRLVSRTDSIESAASTQYAGDDDLDAKSPGTTISTPDNQAEERANSQAKGEDDYAEVEATPTSAASAPAGPPAAAEDETIQHIDDEASASALTLLALGSMGGWGPSPVPPRHPAALATANIQGSACWPPLAPVAPSASPLMSGGVAGVVRPPPRPLSRPSPPPASSALLAAAGPRPLSKMTMDILGTQSDGGFGDAHVGSLGGGQVTVVDGTAAPKHAANAKRRANEDERIRHFGWSLVEVEGGKRVWAHPVHGTATSKKAVFRFHAAEPPVKKPRASQWGETLEPPAHAL